MIQLIPKQGQYYTFFTIEPPSFVVINHKLYIVAVYNYNDKISGMFYCHVMGTSYHFSRNRDDVVLFYFSPYSKSELGGMGIEKFMRKSTESEIIGNEYGLL